MQSLVQLWRQLSIELGLLCDTNVSRDNETVSRRVKDEGDAFLRITLPAFGKGFDRSLELGQVSSDLFPGFRFRGGLPCFLGGFLRNVFDASGRILDDPCVESIQAVRQLCLMFGKIRGECTSRRNREAVRGYIQADDLCGIWDETLPSAASELVDVSRLLLGWLLSDADWRVLNDELSPRHGPGATADKLLGNKKFDMDYWPDHLDSRFPWDEWAIANPRYSEDGPNRSIPLRAATLCLVPKTMLTPRIIVEEPTALQYMQQALMRVMVKSIEQRTSMIGFSDQEVNRDMARSGSISGSLATLDLSEASDRVTYMQAKLCFSATPNLWEGLDACRSSTVELPTGITRTVYKFASMGSAVCFPVEACVFAVAIFAAIRRHHRKMDRSFDLTHAFIKSFEGKVRVYGDDIIIPVEYLSDVEELFSELGWVINRRKSFSNGKFRESCGGDYWNGFDVTPVRVRDPLPTSIRQSHQMHSLVSLRNQLYMAGYWQTTAHLDRWLGKLLKGNFPVAGDQVDGFVRHSRSFEPRGFATDRYQRPLVRAFRNISPIPKNQASEHGALIKCLTVTSVDGDHLMRSGRPSVVYTKLRWIPAF